MEAEYKNIRVDASAEGCTGVSYCIRLQEAPTRGICCAFHPRTPRQLPFLQMYWRTKTVMSASTPSSGPGKGDDWPRNGTVLRGKWLSVGAERWVQFENGLFLPEKQAGFTILFEQ
jgi:hypothetical protein